MAITDLRMRFMKTSIYKRKDYLLSYCLTFTQPYGESA